MFFAPFYNLFEHMVQPTITDEFDYPRLITDNLAYIERQCIKSVCRDNVEFINESQQANDADELLNEVLEHLKADEYHVLREFKGSSKITTYLSAVISNLVIDLVRKKKDAAVPGKRAASMGTLGAQLYDLVYGRGYSLQDAHGHLVQSHGISEDIDELRGMLEKIHGSNKVNVEADWLYQGKEVLVDGEVEFVVEDPGRNAEELLADAQREQCCNQMLDELLGSLDNEDRLILRMRYPAGDEEKGRTTREIADMLGQTEKAIDSRIRRILLRCREKLINKGLSLDDLIF